MVSFSRLDVEVVITAVNGLCVDGEISCEDIIECDQVFVIAWDAPEEIEVGVEFIIVCFEDDIDPTRLVGGVGLGNETIGRSVPVVDEWCIEVIDVKALGCFSSCGEEVLACFGKIDLARPAPGLVVIGETFEA